MCVDSGPAPSCLVMGQVLGKGPERRLEKPGRGSRGQGSVTERGRRTAVERHVPPSRCEFSRHRTGQEEGEPGKGSCS